MELKLSSANEGISTWIEYQYGISFKIKYIPRARFRSLVDKNTSTKYNPAKRERETRIESEDLVRDFVRECVLDWKGVTYRSLSKIAPIDISAYKEEELDVEQPFDMKSLIELAQHSYALEPFIQEAATDISFHRPGLEEAEKNS